MCFRFEDYGATELARCGEAFTRMMQQNRLCNPLEWRDARAIALAWLDATAASSAVSVAGPVLRQLGAVPLALDLAHVALNDGALLLAVAHEPPAESETHGYVNLLARAAALAATQSRAKLLVSQCRDSAARRLIVDWMLELRDQLGDHAPWLWLENPGSTEQTTCFTLIEQE